MRGVYDLLIYLSSFFLKGLALFNKKMKLFVNGRKDVFEILEKSLSAEDKIVWFHCASLGEFEQGLPIMEALKKWKPNYKVLVSFFSPSGFENKKNTPVADVVVYLPLDTKKNAKKFIALAKPSIAFFVKYEIWPNYLFELEKKRIPTLLISGLFRENQIFFKNYGGFMLKALHTFEHIFVQNEISEKLLQSKNFTNVSVSGDTRFDRVSRQIEMDNSLPFVENFKGKNMCIVCGSTWPEDENLLLEYINIAPKNVKFIIAPHKIDTEKIENLRKKIKSETSLFSEKDTDLSQSKVLIIDTIGLLTKIYSYADIAYVGGAAGNTGLHNILEPATFGVPILIGKNFEKFPEAKKLQNLAGLFAVESASECTRILEKLVNDDSFRKKTGMISGHFVNQNTGATASIMQYMQSIDF
ncbi:3-deoxy-D-manno-octulosonic acid transferase [Aequorivita echinoideorum]|uniref:3-deoxy-D-manno-octulosonic acid transferase n=2 Tax=Aequorivita echinoideorum TaxID=1549647 RepID=A0ABS5S315_9FLAO|nr:3-deoxy-D-manno-octulosonic acid transferase [Aequorivita echinoideorum]